MRDEPLFGYSIPLSLLFSTAPLKSHEYDLIYACMKQMAFLLEHLDPEEHTVEHFLALSYTEMVEGRVVESFKNELNDFVREMRP